MKLTIDKSVFDEAVTAAAGALPARPVLPVLAGLRLSAADNRLEVAGFDYEVSMLRRDTADVAEPGKVLVPGRMLADIARALPHEAVHLSTDEQAAVIECGTARYTLPLLPIEEYPALPGLPPVSGTVDTADLAAAVAQVASAANRDAAARLNGILIEADTEQMTLVATDGYRLAVRRIPWSAPGLTGPVTAVVPAETLTDITKATAGAGTARLHLAADGGLLALSTDQTVHTTRQMEHAFPKWATIMDRAEQTTSTVRVERSALTEAVKRVALVLKSEDPVRLTLTADTITLTANASDTQAEAIDHIPAHLKGESITIAFRPGFFLAALAACDTDEIVLGVRDPSQASLITPATGRHQADEALRYLVMPVRLHG